MGRLIDGVWDCVFCGTDKIQGSIRVCPCCGKTRGQDVKFDMDNPKNYVDDDVAKTINRNPDWLCSYCDSLNSDSLNECHNCGAPKGDSAKNYFEHREEIDRRRAEKDRHIKELTTPEERANSSENYRQERLSDSQNNYHKPETIQKSSNEVKEYYQKDSLSSRPSKPRIPWPNILTGGAVALAAILMVVLLVNLFTPKVMDIEISDMTWERSIGVETLTTVDESGWSLPSGARLHYSQQEIKDYEKVVDHYETKTRTYTEQVLDHYEEYVSGHRDLGNGYFEEITSERPVYRTETRTETYEEPVYRDEPIYATKYYYEIDKWLHSYNSESSGHKSDEMYWNEPTLKNKQRESGRRETCYISFIDEEGKKITYTMDRNEWDVINVGDKITIEVVLGHAKIYREE